MKNMLYAATLLLSFFPALAFSQSTSPSIPSTVFETSKGTASPDYFQVIDWWKKMDTYAPIVKMLEMGPTDAGYPLHLVLVSQDKDFDIPSLKNKKANIVFVLNGIHPGEPDGIDASMLLVRDIVQKKFNLPSNVILALIPVYNIGGALNRSENYRVDQNGPVEKGFRGNSQNLDLNRDFIKADSKEAISFSKIFQLLDPDVFVDNHVSNGADYQHVMTLIASQHNRLGGEMGKFMNEVFEPGLYEKMKSKGYDLVPYVNHFGETPEKGWTQFWDSPRYSSGYASLWNSFAFVPETHMLKPYVQRVDATKKMMESFLEFTASNGKKIHQLRAQAMNENLSRKSFPVAWKNDRSKFKNIVYKGYASGKKNSAVSGLPRLYYDRTKPYTITVPFFNFYTDTLSIATPKAYIIPQGWYKVIDRLMANGVKYSRLKKDSLINVEAYRIENYQASQRPFEGHHVNTNIQVSRSDKAIAFRKGDYLIMLDQKANRFLMETLEPQAEDSYFTWNFFDPILGQKEGFSDYVFEETAAEYLAKHPELKIKLEERKQADSSFAGSARAQLDFIYRNSPYYEKAHLEYPVYRLK
jgi:hypothetical protein